MKRRYFDVVAGPRRLIFFIRASGAKGLPFESRWRRKAAADTPASSGRASAPIVLRRVHTKPCVLYRQRDGSGRIKLD